MTTTASPPRAYLRFEHHDISDVHGPQHPAGAPLDAAALDAIHLDATAIMDSLISGGAHPDFRLGGNEAGRMTTPRQVELMLSKLRKLESEYYGHPVDAFELMRSKAPGLSGLLTLLGDILRSWEKFWTEPATAQRLRYKSDRQRREMLASRRARAGLALPAAQHNRPPAQSVRQISTLMAAPGAPQFVAPAAVTH
jgi:hypothetical protein